MPAMLLRHRSKSIAPMGRSYKWRAFATITPFASA